MAAPIPISWPIDLHRVLAYRHPELIVRLEEKLNIPEQEASELFDDLKRFLFLCATQEERLGPTDRIDEAWHNFILFTKDYRNFCTDILGKFVEHVPLSTRDRSKKDGNLMHATSKLARQVFGDNLSRNWLYRIPQAGSCLSDCTRCSGSSNCKS